MMAAGTGGHLFPALVATEALHRQGLEVHWLLGRPRPLEGRVLQGVEYRQHRIAVVGFAGRGRWHQLLAVPLYALALLQSLLLLLHLRPQVVLGFGGYVCVPGGIAAVLMRIPLVLHEQNAVTGAANRLLARFARVRLEGFAGGFAGNFPGRGQTRLCGNPVRPELLTVPAPEGRLDNREGTPIRVLVLGGSQGAATLNAGVPDALIAAGVPLSIRHQSGVEQQDSVREHYRRLGCGDVPVSVFIEDMAEAYGWADLVVCRAGALTLTELSCVGVAALLIPATSAGDHQLLNARHFAPAAVVLEAGDKLAQQLAGLLSDRDGLRERALAMRRMFHPDAVDTLAAAVAELVS